jgi:hypothetical protein
MILRRYCPAWLHHGPERLPRRLFARNLPETTPHATSPHPTTQLSTAPLTCAIVLGHEVPHGVVTRPRIDGKDRVAGSIPAGGSTRKHR